MRNIKAFLLLTFIMGAHYVFAEDHLTALKMPNGMNSLASFHQGDKTKPAVLILHGFLQTSGFSTVQRLADTLISSDYSVLSPSLSLGIDRRKASLSCEAIHVHSLDEEVKEIQRWVDWLKAKDHKEVILIGHSFGSLQLLAYQHQQTEPSIKGLILTSLVYVNEQLADTELKALQELSNSDTPPVPHTYHLAFCKAYSTLPKAYWSYIRWNQVFTTQALHQVKIPVNLIIGTKDNRIDKDWMQTLAAEGVTLHRIDGASHFFDAEHEFDLHTLVEEVLDTLAE